MKTFFFFGEHLRLCPWSRTFLSLASRGSVLGKAVLGLGLGFFLCPWPWPRALFPRLHLCLISCICSWHTILFFSASKSLMKPFILQVSICFPISFFKIKCTILKRIFLHYTTFSFTKTSDFHKHPITQFVRQKNTNKKANKNLRFIKNYSAVR